jgi:hypothetical protein
MTFFTVELINAADKLQLKFMLLFGLFTEKYCCEKNAVRLVVHIFVWVCLFMRLCSL